MELKDKVAIITGAAKGIGRGIVLAFAKEGCHVVVSDIDESGCKDTAAEAEKTGVKALVIRCDVSRKSEVDQLISKTVDTFGSPDILVNNAGIFPFVPFADMTEEDWDNVLDVNLKSAFLCSQAAVKQMKEGGMIINISSIASVIGYQGLVHYCASKGGMNAMTRALALELAEKKINVNGIAPGAIETPGATGGMSDEMKEQTLSAIPWNEMGRPDDIAQAVLFLASPKSRYITGQTLVVDGGWTLH